MANSYKIPKVGMSTEMLEFISMDYSISGKSSVQVTKEFDNQLFLVLKAGWLVPKFNLDNSTQLKVFWNSCFGWSQCCMISKLFAPVPHQTKGMKEYVANIL